MHTTSEETSLHGFMIILHSTVFQSKVPRGGVTNLTYLNVLSTEFIDCIVSKVCYTDVVIAAMYIFPRNSAYYKDIYFKNSDLLMDYLKEQEHCRQHNICVLKY